MILGIILMITMIMIINDIFLAIVTFSLLLLLTRYTFLLIIYTKFFTKWESLFQNKLR